MNRKNVIRLTESEFKHMISEAVKNIVESYRNNERTEKIDLKLWDIDSFENQQLEEFFRDAINAPDSVFISLTVNEEPYDSGDYNNAPSGGEYYFIDCEVDINNRFKRYFGEENASNLYPIFIEEITEYLETNYDKIMRKIPHYCGYNHDYNSEFDIDYDLY